jgi:hemolysin activation/secretion protein
MSKQQNGVPAARRGLKLTGVVSCGVLGLSAALLPLSANAQERMPGVIDRPAVEVPAEVKQPPKVEPKKEPAMEQPEGAAQVVATLKAVKFSGTPILKEAALQKIAAPYLNRPLKREDIARLKYDLTKQYYDQGYVLVKVTTPPQDLAGGVLEVVVYPGRIGSLEIDSPALNPKVAKAMTKGVVMGDVFNEKAVETAVKDIDDLGNVKARLNLRPGKEVGTTDLLLTTEAAAEDVQQVTVDNYGSKYTGKWVLGVDLNKSNLLHMGETFGLNLRKSNDDLETWMFDYKTPILLSSAKFEFNYLNSRNGIGDILAPLDARGKTERVGAALSWNPINAQQRQVGLRVGLEKRRHESTLGGDPESTDHITQGYVETSYLKRSSRYVFYGDLRVTKGVGLFNASSLGDPLSSRLGGDPRAWRALPVVYSNYRFRENDYLQTIIAGQLSSATLLASDLFVLGGYGSVRGFEPALIVGESGFQYSMEYNHQFPTAGAWTVKAGPFLDGGAVFNRIDTAAPPDTHLFSVGLGLEAKANLFKKVGETKVRIDWGHPVGGYAADVSSNTGYLRLTQSF